MGKLLNFSEPQFSYLKNGMIRQSRGDTKENVLSTRHLEWVQSLLWFDYKSIVLSVGAKTRFSMLFFSESCPLRRKTEHFPIRDQTKHSFRG